MLLSFKLISYIKQGHLVLEKDVVASQGHKKGLVCTVGDLAFAWWSWEGTPLQLLGQFVVVIPLSNFKHFEPSHVTCAVLLHSDLSARGPDTLTQAQWHTRYEFTISHEQSGMGSV